jgi:two-component system phosphate regulon sensor histidine kinase PhoR
VPRTEAGATAGQGALYHLRQTAQDRWRYLLLFAAATTLVIAVLVIAVARFALTPAGLLLLGVAAALLLTGLLMAALDMSARRVRQVIATVERIAGGDLDARVWAGGHGEIGRLGRAVNRMAAKLEKQTRKRNRERDRFDTVLHTMTDGVILLNKQGHVTLINPAALRILRVDPDRVLNHTFVQVVRDHRIADLWAECAQQQVELSSLVEINGDLYLRVVVTPYLRGAANGYVVLFQDLTQLHRLETVRRDFVSNISHELRTPLASIKALADTLRDGALEDPPAAEHFLERMDVEVDEMTHMVSELLELSRIESGQAPLRLQPAAVAGLVKTAADRLNAQAGRAGLSLAVEIEPGLPQVLADSDRIGGVLINLIHNAIKFTPRGGRIDVRAHDSTEGVVVAVADTGIGIPAEDVPRIFERFYKADRARTGGGTGLGLAIAKHTIQAHNGRIWVESVEGQGSTFSFALPVVNLPLT